MALEAVEMGEGGKGEQLTMKFNHSKDEKRTFYSQMKQKSLSLSGRMLQMK